MGIINYNNNYMIIHIFNLIAILITFNSYTSKINKLIMNLVKMISNFIQEISVD